MGTASQGWYYLSKLLGYAAQFWLGDPMEVEVSTPDEKSRRQQTGGKVRVGNVCPYERGPVEK